MVLVVYPLLLKIFTKISPRKFFKAIGPAQLLAFSSSSSSAKMSLGSLLPIWQTK